MNTKRMPHPNRETFARGVSKALSAYLLLGLAFAAIENVVSAYSGAPSIFSWSGSWAEQAEMFVYWFVLPMLLWPVYLVQNLLFWL